MSKKNIKKVAKELADNKKDTKDFAKLIKMLLDEERK